MLISSLRSPAKETKSAMADHKFKAGQSVTVMETNQNGLQRTGYGLAPRGKFQIVRPLPAEQGQNQYRIKSNLDGHERVVKEHEIA